MYNLFLLWTAGALRQAGHNVAFVDGQAEQWSAERAVRELARGEYDCLVALLNLPSIYGDLELLRMMSAAAPTVPIVAIGTVCAILTYEIARSGAVHYIAVTEPEVTVPEIVSQVLNGGDASRVPSAICCAEDGRILVAPRRAPVALDLLPPIPYELLNAEKYRRAEDGLRFGVVLLSKGCPFKCAYYCPYPLTFGNRVRARRVESAIEEIEYLVRHCGVEHLIFRDQNFTLLSDHVRVLCDLLLTRGIKVRWLCETRFNLLPDASLLRLMRSAGCEQIHLGLESGNPAIFEGVGKPGAEYRQVDRAMHMLARAGMKVMLHLIVGFPGDRWNTIRQTALLARRYGGRYGASVNVTTLVPYPGTDLYKEASLGGLLRTRDWSRYGGNDIVARTRHMSFTELEWAILYLKWVKDLRLRAPLGATVRLLRSAAHQLQRFVRSQE